MAEDGDADGTGSSARLQELSTAAIGRQQGHRRTAPSLTASRSSSTLRSAFASPEDAVARLEADLRLSAEIGQALVDEQKTLQAKLDAAEKAREGLLEKLAGSVRETVQLDKVR